MARKLSRMNDMKMAWGRGMLKEKPTLTDAELIAGLRRKFGKGLPKRLRLQLLIKTDAVKSGRWSATKAQLSNKPKTAGEKAVDLAWAKGTKVIDAGLAAAWKSTFPAAEKMSSGFKPITVTTTTPAVNGELTDGLRRLLIMVRNEMAKSDICDLHLDEDGNLEMTVKRVSHINTRLPERARDPEEVFENDAKS